MPITGMSYVTVTGTFINLYTGLPSTGTVRLSMSGRLVNTATNQVVVPGDFSATLNAAGSFSLVVPATDDPDFLPLDRFWSVTEYIDGQSRTYAVLLPAASPTQDLADIAPIDPTDPVNVYTLTGSLTGTYVMPLGLFSTFAGTPPTVPTAATVARSEGYSTAGVGDASYRYDAAVDAAYVTANPRTSFLAANGRGFRIVDYRISPFQMGALGGATDDNVALQAYFDYVTANDVRVADVAGSFTSSVGLIVGRLGTPATVVYSGRFKLTMTGTGAIAFKIIGNAEGNWAYLRLTGPGGSTFASRTWQVGLVCETTSGRMKFGYISTDFFAYYGVFARTGNTTLNDYGTVRAFDCGTGVLGLSLTTAWSNPVRSGTTGSLGQRTTLDVTVLPPAYITNGTYGAVGDTPYMLRITESTGETRLHFIYAIGASTISVFPWVELTATPATAEYVWGGGMFFGGVDANVNGFESLDATRCGIGLCAASNYAPIGRRLVAQVCGTALLWGRQPSGGTYGGRIDGLYVENNVEDVVHLAVTLGNTGTGDQPTVANVVGSEYALNLAKIKTVGVPRFTGELFSTTFLGMAGRISYHGRNLFREKYPYLGTALTAYPNTAFEVNRPDMVMPLAGNTVSVGIAPLNLNLHRLTGIDSVRVVIIGTGAGGFPTGTITFPVPAGWTLNGGASSVAFSGLSNGPAQFMFRFDALTLAAVVYQLAPPVAAPSTVTLTTTASTAYTLAATDAGSELETTAVTAVTVTLPLNATVAIPVGSVLAVRQMAAGQVTVAGAGGVTLRAPGGAKTRAQYSTVSLVKRATDEWVIAGDTTT